MKDIKTLTQWRILHTFSLYFNAMKTILCNFLLVVLYSSAYSQSQNDILFQYSGQSITIRKFRENHPLYYSEKNNRLISYKEEVKMFPDSAYYLVKPKIVIFEAKMFETDSKPQVNIRVDYYYQIAKKEPAKIDEFHQSYYPSIMRVHSAAIAPVLSCKTSAESSW